MSSSDNRPARIGMITDQTGALSFMGVANANVTKMVVEDINARGGDLAQFADEVTGRTLAMWGTDGVLDSSHVTPLGELPGSVVINFATVDALCHAWDLAASVGHPIEFPPEMIPTISVVVGATCTDAAREHGLIKPVAPIPADATGTERLMAAAGRSISR